MLVERSKDDRRKYPRYSVDWKAAIKMGGNEIYHDHLSDLSLGGAGIYTDKSIRTDGPLVILINTPLPHFRKKEVLTRIECTLSHTILSPGKPKFHIGVHFSSFQGIERHLLAEALSSRPALPTRRIH